MPMFSYLCLSCGLSFKKRAPRGTDTFKCECCGEQAQRELPTSFNSAVDLKVESTDPQNTGSSLDYDYDTIIAEDSKNRWEAVHQRNMSKEEVLRANPNADRGSLSQNLDGTYRVMDSSERALKDQVRENHNKYVKTHLQGKPPQTQS